MIMANDIPVQYIFCVECDSRSQTDYIYIRWFLNALYEVRHNIDKVTPLYLNGKQNYSSLSIQSKLSRMTNLWSGTTKIIFFFDTDAVNVENSSENQSIQKFCDEKGYNYVWFVREIEDIFLIGIEKDKSKVKMAREFIQSKKQKQALIYENMKVSSPCKRGQSNIALILDSFFVRKNTHQN